MKEPEIFITSKCHIPRMRAHRILRDAGYSNWRLVVDNAEQADRAQSLGIPRIEVSGKPNDIPPQDGIAWNREWIEKNLVPVGSWYVSLDDNVSGWTALPEPDYDREYLPFEFEDRPWREMFNTPCPFETMVKRYRETAEFCESVGSWAGGFAIEHNYYFRSRKYQWRGYVRAQNAVWKNTGRPFYYWRGAMLEDFVRSVDVVAHCGKVVINRFIKPHKPEFEAGGIGTFEERHPNLVSCSDELMRRYPGLLRRSKGRDFQLSFALNTDKSIEKWRKEHPCVS